MIGCKGQFSGDGWHGVVGASEEEGHGWVEHFELMIIFIEPSAGMYYLGAGLYDMKLIVNMLES